MKRLFQRIGMTLPRYIMSGLGLNAVAFAGYFTMTYNGMTPVHAATLSYVACLALGYVVHRFFSFRSGAPHRTSVPAYLLAHLVGYSTNILVLVTVPNWFGLPHEVAQVLATLIVAGELYLLFLFVAFPK